MNGNTAGTKSCDMDLQLKLASIPSKSRQSTFTKYQVLIVNLIQDSGIYSSTTMGPELSLLSVLNSVTYNRPQLLLNSAKEFTQRRARFEHKNNSYDFGKRLGYIS